MQNLLDDCSVESVKEEILLLKVAELKNVCRSIGLPLSGRKVELQDRLSSYLMAPGRAGINDPFRTPAVNILVKKAGAGDPVPKYETLLHALVSGSYLHPVASGHQDVSSLNAKSGVTMNNKLMGKQHLRFQTSPFYNLKRLIGSESAPNAPNKRGVANISFKFTDEEVRMIKDNEKIKLYLLSGISSPLDSSNDIPIQFPLRNEIKFNGAQIKDNVHGLKNKIGTAKPADLTPYINWPPQSNLLQLVYAFTKDDHILYVYFVELVKTEELLEKTLRRPKIVKPATLQYIKQTLSEEEDEDLMTTSTVMSLQCPISYSRMKYPVKSIHCRHLQCFDAQWFIESQRQIPTWQCPVCQKTIHIEDLSICEFVQEIINATDEEVEQVEISKDGSWVVKEDVDNQNPSSNSTPQRKSHATPDIKPEESNDLDYNGSNSGGEPVVISLDSEEEDEITQAISNNHGNNNSTTNDNNDVQTHNNKLISNQSKTRSNNVDNVDDSNKENDLLDDEDMAFIEELANSIQDNESRNEERETALIPFSNLSANNTNSVHSNKLISRNQTLDPRRPSLFNPSPSHHHRQLNNSATGAVYSNTTLNPNQNTGQVIPDLLGRAPLNNDRNISSTNTVPLPNVPNLTNADSILFNGNNADTNSTPSNISSPPAQVRPPITEPSAPIRAQPVNSINPLDRESTSPVSLNKPTLPPLPQVSIDIPNRNNAVAPNLPPLHDPRRRKPEVSPFLPKKNYRNVLPKKRVLSNGESLTEPTVSSPATSLQPSSSILTPSVPPIPPIPSPSNPSNVTAHTPPNDSLNSDDLIDLTSD